MLLLNHWQLLPWRSGILALRLTTDAYAFEKNKRPFVFMLPARLNMRKARTMANFFAVVISVKEGKGYDTVEEGGRCQK